MKYYKNNQEKKRFLCHVIQFFHCCFEMFYGTVFEQINVRTDM